jgi:hypothetical protein
MIGCKNGTRVIGLFAAIAACWLATITVPTGALAQSSGCPKGTSYPDGCVGRPINGNKLVPTFFTTYATQSGQTYVTRPPWNVAGVDYAVGVPSGLVLKDPAVATLPSGCSYSASIVTCRGSGNLTIDGWDFRLHNCTLLDIFNYTGAITIQNSWFKMGPSAQCQNTWGLLRIESSTLGSSLIVQDCQFNGMAPTYPAIGNFISVFDARPAGTSLYRYNVFHQSVARPISTTSPSDWTARYNYIEGVDYGNSAHGEVELIGSTSLTNNLTIEYNTFLAPANYGGGMTTTWYISSGNANGQKFGSVNVNNNTTAINLFGGKAGKVVVSSALLEFAWNNTVSTANILNNYIDPTGAYLCLVNIDGTPIGTLNMSGNTNLLNGSTIADMTQATCYGHH